MLKTKSIFSVPVLLFIFFFSGLFYSCSEDPVISNTGPYVFDSARFDWKIDTLMGNWYYSGLWACDTNELFTIQNNNDLIVHIKNNIINYYNQSDFYPGCVNGISNNEVYFGGSIEVNGNPKPHIRKWNGSAFIDIPVELTNKDETGFHKSIVNSSNDMWFCGLKPYIYHYDGFNFTTYPIEIIDTATRIIHAFRDYQNKPSFLALHLHSGIDTLAINYFYQFNGMTWEKIFEDITGINYMKAYQNLNDKVCRRTLSDIEVYEGNSFTTIISNTPIRLHYIGGTSPNNILALGTDNNWGYLFHWNGAKWSLELSGNFMWSDNQVFMINDNYFIAWKSNVLHYYTILYRGKRKM